MPSVAKRMTSVSISGSISATEKSLLLDLGTPLSICRLVCDLLDAVNEPPSNSAQITVDQALWDLTNMKNNPQTFLFDRTCPKKALDDTCLFNPKDGHLFGREKEMEALMGVKRDFSRHFNSLAQSSSDSIQGSSFRGEATFLAGYAGSGKSCLLRSLVHKCHEEQWFVLKCKFDKQTAPLKILAKAFDDFFGLWGPSNEDEHSNLGPSMMKSFRQVCRTMFSTIDSEGYSQLCDLIPNFSRIFPLATSLARDQRSFSNDEVGSAEQRRVHLFHMLFKSLCSTCRPVLVAFDDLQWCNSLVTGCITDFLVNDFIHGEEAGKQGLLIAGTFRSSEVKEGDDLIEKINFLKHSRKTNVTMLTVDELAEKDITQLISAKLGLPIRYTSELARLVHHKTRGNPLYVRQFLKSIIQNNMLEFSVRSRRWTWDCDTVDLQMISDGVAELLTSTFNLLPVPLMKTLKVVSCFGNQFEDSSIELMNSCHQVLPFDMHKELQLAVKEGILEKAGTVYAFAHDLIHEAIYEMVPASNRHLLHKTIGTSLLKSASNKQTIHLQLALERQCYACKAIGILSLAILLQLGEEFPPPVNLSIALTTLSAMQPMLANISKDQMKSLPSMTDTTKLQAMKFLSMLCTLSVMSAPMLLPILSCRMMRLTLDHGFCHDSIIGLVMTGYSL
ncbi:hypothetical protein ACHAXR_005679, partial [Thalassiosira sp. AJA248-18]